MKAAQIEKLLTGVMNNLIESLTDDTIINIFKHDAYITGGCIPSMLMDEYINDYDVYFTDYIYAEKVKKYYEKRKPKAEDLTLSKVFEPKLITENSINLTDKVQLITKFAGRPESVTNLFDWQHITSYFSLDKGLILTDDVYRSIFERELIYTGSSYPLSSLLRLRKYIKKGWGVSTKTMVHIVMDILAAFEAPESKNPDNYSLEAVEHHIIKNDDDIPIGELTGYEKTFDFKENKYKVSIDTLIHQLNGVDPLTIQEELKKQTGKHLSLKEVLELL